MVPFLFVLLIASWVSFILIYQRQSRLIATARKEHEDVRVEEDRVFDFLHGLGEAFTGEIRSDHLHRLIVEGAMRVIEAHGGALYLEDRVRNLLVNRYISKSCPPLIEIPPHILAQVDSTPQALQSYLRLHSVQPGEGLVGEAWHSPEPLLVNSGDPRLEALRDTTLRTGSAMLAPLLYGTQNLGVLAVAEGPMGMPFTVEDLKVFKGVAEQSAFALYNAIIYSEANEKKRLDSDLQVAHEIQRILLPSTAPEFPGFDIAGLNIPARQVSGDYFDYIRIDERRLGVAIADVSGKGVPASLIMAMCRSVLHSHATGNASPSDALKKVNRQLFPDIKEDMFISMAYVVIDSDTGVVTLCRAGHDAPLHYNAAEQVITKVKPPGMALGIDSGAVFDRMAKDFEVVMTSGDVLIMYTDGITEALDAKGAEFGLTRMIQSIHVSASGGARTMIDRITDDVTSFIGPTPRNDDITLIAIRKK